MEKMFLPMMVIAIVIYAFYFWYKETMEQTEGNVGTAITTSLIMTSPGYMVVVAVLLRSYFRA